MTDPTTPSRYSITGLLARGEQPFSDLDEEALTALGKGIGRRPLAVPVVITSDGVLIDGHQRLKSMLAQGRKFIDASDVRVVDEANEDNALEWAVRLNVQRRQLTVEEKAEVARRLQRERKWSQAKIATIFGVSRPAVSQWLGKTRTAEDDAPTTVIGIDGVEQPVAPKRPARPKLTPMPWDLHKGEAFAVVEKLTRRLPSEWFPNRDALTDLEWDAAKTRLTDLEVVLGEVLTSLGVDPPTVAESEPPAESFTSHASEGDWEAYEAFWLEQTGSPMPHTDAEWVLTVTCPVCGEHPGDHCSGVKTHHRARMEETGNLQARVWHAWLAEHPDPEQEPAVSERAKPMEPTEPMEKWDAFWLEQTGYRYPRTEGGFAMTIRCPTCGRDPGVDCFGIATAYVHEERVNEAVRTILTPVMEAWVKEYPGQPLPPWL